MDNIFKLISELGSKKFTVHFYKDNQETIYEKKEMTYIEIGFYLLSNSNIKYIEIMENE